VQVDLGFGERRDVELVMDRICRGIGSERKQIFLQVEVGHDADTLRLLLLLAVEIESRDMRR
jgi:hypothetical protein